MNEKRGYSAAAHHEKKGFIITGGYDGSRRLASSEITKDGVSFEYFTPLPIALQGHCAVALNDDDDGDLFVTGGSTGGFFTSISYNKRAFMHKMNHWWVEVAGMPTARESKKPSLEIINVLIC